MTWKSMPRKSFSDKENNFARCAKYILCKFLRLLTCTDMNRPSNDASLCQFLQLQQPRHLLDVIVSVQLDRKSADIEYVINGLRWRWIFVK